jgi:hypothetical protein
MLPWTQLFQFTIYSHFNPTIYAHEKANVTCYVIVIVKVSAYIDTSTLVKSNYNSHYFNTYCKLTNIYFQQKLDITKNLEFQVLYYSTSQASDIVDYSCYNSARVGLYNKCSNMHGATLKIVNYYLCSYACLILSLAAEAFKFQLYPGNPFKEFMSKMQAV